MRFIEIRLTKRENNEWPKQMVSYQRNVSISGHDLDVKKENTWKNGRKTA